MDLKSEIIAKLEVYDENELPTPPDGQKFFTCIGGKKNFQCFLSDERVSKGQFIMQHEGELDDCLKPVYENEGIVVRQDAKYAIPGFYIVSPKEHFSNIHTMPPVLFQRCMLIAKNVQQGLASLGIPRTHIYHDEKYKKPISAHFWVLPLYERMIKEQGLNASITSKDIWDYQDSFPRYSDTKYKIRELNVRMKHFFRTTRMQQRDNEFTEKLNHLKARGLCHER
ncbi:MAG: hypothetical protein J6Y91_04080 [Alphaproteobacteria bacterium]|nr:hypothetical protein [Alphaproteobacteria bacterium]